MSADNGIAVRQIGDQWWVAYGFLSDDEFGSNDFMCSGSRYSTREAALLAAHDMAKQYSVLEYGVMELEE